MIDAFDVAVRQQAYLEGVKNYEEDAFDPVALALVALLALMLTQYGYERISDMPKRVLTKFIAEFNKKASGKLASFVKTFTGELRKVARADMFVTMTNFALLTGKPARSPNLNASWGRVINEPIAGTGHMPLAMLRDFTRSAYNQFRLAIMRAYANGYTLSEFMGLLRGTKDANFKDGILHKLRNQFNTVQQTIIQHAHAWTLFNFGRLFYSHYQWVSIIDSATTDICRHRNGRIYSYKDGPRPPAHYNCRSTIVGLDSDQPRLQPQRWYDWLKKQPPRFQRDMVGPFYAKRLRDGQLTASDLPKFEKAQKLSPDQYRRKQPQMIEE